MIISIIGINFMSRKDAKPLRLPSLRLRVRILISDSLYCLPDLSN